VTLSATQIGRAGEYHVCALLERHGIEASRVDGKFDLIAVLPSGKILRMEVKTANRNNRGSYQFLRGKSECDYFALLNNEAMIVRMFPVHHPFIQGKRTIRLLDRDFTEEAAAADMQALLSL